MTTDRPKFYTLSPEAEAEVAEILRNAADLKALAVKPRQPTTCWIIVDASGNQLVASIRGDEERCKSDFIKDQGMLSSTWGEVSQHLGVECREVTLE